MAGVKLPIRLGVNTEEIEKVKGVVEITLGIGGCLGSVRCDICGKDFTTNHIRNHHGSFINFFWAVKNMQGLWQQPKHNLEHAMSHGSQALKPSVSLCNLWQEFQQEAGAVMPC